MIKKSFLVGSVEQSSLRERQDKFRSFVSRNGKDCVKQTLVVGC